MIPIVFLPNSYGSGLFKEVILRKFLATVHQIQLEVFAVSSDDLVE